MEFNELIKIRRSVRAYENVVPSHEALVNIVTKAQMAPSWKNQQTSRCYVIESPDAIEDLRDKILPPGNSRSAHGAALIVTTFVKDIVGFGPDKTPTNELGNYWGAYDLGLHDAYMVLAASEEGLDTLIMGIRDAEAIRKELNIPEEEIVVSVIAVGKRAQEPALRPRKELSEVVKFF